MVCEARMALGHGGVCDHRVWGSAGEKEAMPDHKQVGNPRRMEAGVGAGRRTGADGDNFEGMMRAGSDQSGWKWAEEAHNNRFSRKSWDMCGGRRTQRG